MFPNKKLKVGQGEMQNGKLENCSFAKEAGSRLSKQSWMKQRNALNPFEVFPLEIWHEILTQLEDSRDILNVLRGMPQLDISINKEKRYWYIDQILPFLYGLIELKDVLTLRLVCKQWQRRVDHFIPNQPHYRAYSEDLHKENVNFWEGVTYSFKSFRGCVTEMVPEKNSSTKLDLIWDQSRTRNPFVFRHLQLDIQEIDTGCDVVFDLDKDNEESFEEYDEESFEGVDVQLHILQQFGTHLWYLCVDNVTIGNLETANNVVKIFNLTPNLKAVEFMLREETLEIEEETDFDVLARGLPELPFLETLTILADEVEDFQDEEFVKILVTRYGPQIRRLQIPMMYWKIEEFKNLLSQLTELSIELYCERPSDNLKHISKLGNLLNSISTPNLTKLEFLIEQGFKYEISIEKHILKWLKRFPKLQYFRVSANIGSNYGQIDWKESGTADPVNDCIPSLQTLKIPDGHGLSYNFLRCLPSLRHLEIQLYATSRLNSQPFVPESSVKLRETIKTRKLYESNIWEFLPRLKTVKLRWTEYYSNKFWKSFCDFNRDTYDKMRKVDQKVSS